MVRILNLVFLIVLTGFISVTSFSQQNTEIIIQKGHLFPINNIEYSFDDKFIMSIDNGSQIIFWNALLGKQVGSYIDEAQILNAKFFPNSNDVIWVNSNNEIIIWSIKNSKIVKTIKWNEKIVDFCFLSQNELLIADNNLVYYNINNQEKKNWYPKKFIGLKSDILKKEVFAISEDKLEIFLFDFQSKILINNVHIQNSFKEKISAKKSFDFEKIDYNFQKRLLFFPYLNTIFGFDIEKNTSFIKKFTDYFDVNCTSVAYSDKNNVLVYGTSDDKIFIYDINDKKNKVFDLHLSEITNLKFSKNQNYFASSSKDHSIIIWDLKNLKPIHRLRMSSLPLTSITSDKEGNSFAIGNTLGEIKYINLYNKGGQPTLKNYWAHADYVSDIIILDSSIYAVGYDNKVSISNTTNNTILKINFNKNKKAKKIKKLRKKLNEYSFKKVNQIDFIDDKKTLLISGEKNGKDRYYTLNPYNEILKLSKTNYEHTKIDLSIYKLKKEIKVFDINQTSNYLVYSDKKDIFLNTKNQEYFIGSHDYNISDLIFIPHTNKIASIGIDGVMKIWKYNFEGDFSVNLLCSIVPLDRDKLLIYTPDNYYFSINQAMHEIGFKIGEEYYLVEQFDLKYNRPDIVIESLGYADTNLIKAYHNAYLKRIKKMGFTESMLNSEIQIPEFEIKNLNNIPKITENDYLELEVKANDSKYLLDRINIWINDVAIFGSNGYDLRSQNSHNFENKIKINLMNGYNQIKLNILNQAGVESYVKTIEIQSNKGKIKPDLYLISVGVSNYKDSKYNLNYASKDALDIVSVFSNKKKYYDRVFTKTLINEEVTINNVSSLKDFFNKADINDQVIVFFAGHGVLDEKFDYYFASHEMDFNNPSKYGIPYEMIENILDGIKPIKKLLFMDTCHSGEVDKDEIELKNGEEENKENDIVFRNVGEAYQNKNSHLGIKNTTELSKELFTDLRKGTGATVISSSGGVEFAMESSEWKNGLFTYCLLYGLTSQKADIDKNGEISVIELQTYVQKQVKTLSNGKQTPTSRIENQTLDWRVW